MRNFIIIVFTILLVACGNDKPVKQEVKITGYAQGTTYSVIYLSEGGRSYQRAIDSALIEIDNSMSTYNKNSLISKYNRGESDLVYDDNFFQVYKISYDVYTETDSLFDPTIAPLVNAWGFGFEKAYEIDSSSIDSLLTLVGLEGVVFLKDEVLRHSKSVMLDFNAVAQGYTVDVLGGLLEKRGINNYLVEVGGELKAKGVNIQDTLWRVGIDRPLPELQEREIEAIVHLDNKSLATSGNYRKYYEKNGKKYSHTINPKTGYPVEHNLLSATVIAEECAYADAYATAFMVMGLEKSKEFLSKHQELSALLIYNDENGVMQTFVTEILKAKIELNPSKK